MEYKLIAMDFDGTLLDDNKNVSLENKNALIKYRSEGYLIVGVTARSLESVRKNIDFSLFDYFILHNGVCIYDVVNSNGWYEGYVSKDVAFDITNMMENVSSEITFCTYDTYNIYRKEKKSTDYFVKTVDSLAEVVDKIARINIYLDKSLDFDYYKKLIDSKYGDVECYFMEATNESRFMVVGPLGLNKGSTLKRLGDMVGIDLSEMIFFGDALSDIPAIRAVGCGVAMENALSEVKSVSDDITLTNNESGIGVYLKQLLG